MPDFFRGEPVSLSDYPPNTEEKKKKIGAFFAGPANPGETAGKVPGLVKEIEEREKGIEKGGRFGMWWVGKVRVY